MTNRCFLSSNENDTSYCHQHFRCTTLLLASKFSQGTLMPYPSCMECNLRLFLHLVFLAFPNINITGTRQTKVFYKCIYFKDGAGTFADELDDSMAGNANLKIKGWERRIEV